MIKVPYEFLIDLFGQSYEFIGEIADTILVDETKNPKKIVVNLPHLVEDDYYFNSCKKTYKDKFNVTKQDNKTFILERIKNMELLNKIKQDRMTFYKSGNRDNYVTLGIIVGDIETLSKKQSVEDKDVLQILKKYKKSLEETMKLKPSEKLTKELTLVEQYLPKTVSEEHLSRVIDDLISTGINTMPLLMKSLKETFGDQLDGKMASSLVKSKI